MCLYSFSQAHYDSLWSPLIPEARTKLAQVTGTIRQTQAPVSALFWPVTAFTHKVFTGPDRQKPCGYQWCSGGYVLQRGKFRVLLGILGCYRLCPLEVTKSPRIAKGAFLSAASPPPPQGPGTVLVFPVLWRLLPWGSPEEEVSSGVGWVLLLIHPLPRFCC